MEVALLLLALIALLGFVRWDLRRIERSAVPTEVARSPRTFESTKWLAYFGLALIGAMAAIDQALHPPAPPFTGKWSFLWRALHESFGAYGPAGFSALVAIAFSAAAFLQRRRMVRREK